MSHRTTMFFGDHQNTSPSVGNNPFRKDGSRKQQVYLKDPIASYGGQPVPTMNRSQQVPDYGNKQTEAPLQIQNPSQMYISQKIPPRPQTVMEPYGTNPYNNTQSTRTLHPTPQQYQQQSNNNTALLLPELAVTSQHVVTKQPSHMDDLLQLEPPSNLPNPLLKPIESLDDLLSGLDMEPSLDHGKFKAGRDPKNFVRFDDSASVGRAIESQLDLLASSKDMFEKVQDDDILNEYDSLFTTSYTQQESLQASQSRLNSFQPESKQVETQTFVPVQSNSQYDSSQPPAMQSSQLPPMQNHNFTQQLLMQNQCSQPPPMQNQNSRLPPMQNQSCQPPLMQNQNSQPPLMQNQNSQPPLIPRPPSQNEKRKSNETQTSQTSTNSQPVLYNPNESKPKTPEVETITNQKAQTRPPIITSYPPQVTMTSYDRDTYPKLSTRQPQAFNSNTNSYVKVCDSVNLLQNQYVLPPYPIETCQDNTITNPLSSTFRCTLGKIPQTKALLEKAHVPFGLLVQPFKNMEKVPLLQPGTINRCRFCRGYINPYVHFVDQRKWQCTLCNRVNELSSDFGYDQRTGGYADVSQASEICVPCVDYIASSEYVLRPPPPAVYFFILDVTAKAVASGYFRTVCDTLLQNLDSLPGDSRTQFGFITFNSFIHFYSFKKTSGQIVRMCVTDTEEPFTVDPDVLLNFESHKTLIEKLLLELPDDYEQNNYPTYENSASCLGASLQMALLIMSNTGGRVTLFQTCLPTIDPGSLTCRDDGKKAVAHEPARLNPSTDFYKKLSLDCSSRQICIDLFLINDQHADLGSLSCLPKYTGGTIHYFPLVSNSYDNAVTMDKFKRCLEHYLKRNTGLEAVMRLRCSQGLSIEEFYGHFFVRAFDLLNVSNVNSDIGYGVKIALTDALTQANFSYFQAAVLYTSCTGERRVRVQTLQLPVSSSLNSIILSIDQECVVGVLAKMAAQCLLKNGLSDTREGLMNGVADILESYNKAVNATTGPRTLLAPNNLKLLPLYVNALLKHIAFCTSEQAKCDDRVYALCAMNTLPLNYLLQFIYPHLYPVHELEKHLKQLEPSETTNSEQIEDEESIQVVVCVPPRLHLTSQNINIQGAYILDCIDIIMLFIGKNVSPEFCKNVLGYPHVSAITEFTTLAGIGTPESNRLHRFISELQEKKPYKVPIIIIREDFVLFPRFCERMIDDRYQSMMSYVEFLYQVKKNMNNDRDSD